MLLDLCTFDTVNHQHHTWFSSKPEGGSFSLLRDLIINLKSLKSLKFLNIKVSPRSSLFSFKSTSDGKSHFK